MAEHHSECPKEIVSCHHSSIGCSTKIKREELPSHDKERVSSHLDLAIREIQKLRVTCRFMAEKSAFIKMKHFSQHNISTGFYLPPCGYKMALKISINVSLLDCYLALLPGEYDDILEWPFQGEVTVELLNQKEDKEHDSTKIIFNEDTPDEYKNRVVPPNVNGEWWI